MLTWSYNTAHEDLTPVQSDATSNISEIEQRTLAYSNTMQLHLVTPEQIVLLVPCNVVVIHACSSALFKTVFHAKRGTTTATLILLFCTTNFFLVPWYLHGEHSKHGPRSLCLGIHRNSLLAVRQHQAYALWGDFLLVSLAWRVGPQAKGKQLRCGISPSSPRFPRRARP